MSQLDQQRQDVRVVVVGAINVDMVVSADALPVPGQTVVGSGPERHGGGKGANAAVAAARIGLPTHLVGAVGRDGLADVALADLREAGVELAGVVHLPDQPTGVALIVVDRDGENQIAVGAGANGKLDAGWVVDQVEAAVVAGARCMLVSTEIPGAAVAAAVRTAAKAPIRCVLNTAPPIPEVLELLDEGPLLTPNARELGLLTTMLAEQSGDGGAIGATPAQQAIGLACRTGQPVVVTLGSEGALVADPDGRVQTIAPPRVKAVDTTGAGDTFNGVLAARLAGGDTVAEAVAVAVVAASLSIASAGARGGMPHREELAEALRDPDRHLVAS